MSDELIRIAEVPLWTLAPFAVIVGGALLWAVRWILRDQRPH